MKRGVWIVEKLGWDTDGDWVPGIELFFSRTDARCSAEAANEAERYFPPNHRSRYRAVRYVPAAELTRKPRRKR